MTVAAPAQAPAPGLLARAVGVVVSPRATFEQLVKAPKVAGILVLVGVVISLAQALPQFTAAGRQAAVDSAVQQIERFSGRPVTDEQYAAIQKQAPIRAYFTMAFTPIGVAVGVLFFAGLYFVAFNVALGGTATYKAVLSVAAHAAVIGALGAALGAPVQLLQGSYSPMGPFTLGGLFPMLDESSFLARFLGVISIFSLWGTVVTAIGLGVLYGRKSRNIAVALFGLTVLFAAVWATVLSFFSSR
jgi:hypothetical protein